MRRRGAGWRSREADGARGHSPAAEGESPPPRGASRGRMLRGAHRSLHLRAARFPSKAGLGPPGDQATSVSRPPCSGKDPAAARSSPTSASRACALLLADSQRGPLDWQMRGQHTHSHPPTEPQETTRGHLLWDQVPAVAPFPAGDSETLGWGGASVWSWEPEALGLAAVVAWNHEPQENTCLILTHSCGCEPRKQVLLMRLLQLRCGPVDSGWVLVLLLEAL
ncbi:uncharacterized protein LOC119517846 [Choloepus didactylus]|uniref:uncharacterized protein LOC119517846 n=1 Tax=Choloepus didactylus TaxID=27675 RepID=UPI00189EF177|nr:uncharacterized protein LOC119517846 [Choloepus didactylus]